MTLTTPSGILAVDASSTRTGYAVLTPAGDLVDAGLLKPARTSDAAAGRVSAMLRDLRGVAEEHHPAVCVLEAAGAKTHRRVGSAAGLAVYGFAVGACWAVLWGVCPRVELVEPNAWTQGRGKAVRAAALRVRFPGFDWTGDTGHDAADAVGIGLWWLADQGGRMNLADATARENIL